MPTIPKTHQLVRLGTLDFHQSPPILLSHDRLTTTEIYLSTLIQEDSLRIQQQVEFEGSSKDFLALTHDNSYGGLTKDETNSCCL